MSHDFQGHPVSCGRCYDRKQVARAGSMVPCPSCTAEAMLKRVEVRKFLLDGRDAERAANQMISIANGQPIEGLDLGVVTEIRMPAGEVGALVTGGCCAEARSRSCVCIRSTFCPVHGVLCIGSHD
jgi:hypothetical protein